MIKEFREFILRGNVLDLAIGFIMGAAFGSIVNSLVKDVIMPPIGLVLGKVDFANLFIPLDGKTYPSLKAAQDAGASTLNYGLFITTIIQFVIIAFVVFLLVRAVNRMMPKPKVVPEEPKTKECPYCLTQVPIKATRCPACTSDLKTA